MKKEKTEVTEVGDAISKSDDSIKITITKDAEKILSETVKRINGEFEGGKVSRQVVASWLLEEACNEMSDAEVKEIQSHSFDPAIALSTLYKRIQDGENIPLELTQLLRAQAGLDASIKKSSRSKLTRDSTNGGISENKDVA